MGEFFVRRPIVAMVVSIVIVIIGLLALRSVPISQYPEIVPPMIKINTSFVGANAVNVEQGVAAVMEQKINGVEEMIYMKSTNSSDGNLSLDVSFKVGTDLDNANMLTQNRVSQAQPFMPPAVKQFGITTKKSLTFPLIVISLTSGNPAYDAMFLSNYASININDALARISGVGEVKMLGSSDYAMRVWVKPDIMSKLDITIEDVTKALQDQNVISPGGKFGAVQEGEPVAGGGDDEQCAHPHDGGLAAEEEFEEKGLFRPCQLAVILADAEQAQARHHQHQCAEGLPEPALGDEAGGGKKQDAFFILVHVAAVKVEGVKAASGQQQCIEPVEPGQGFKEGRLGAVVFCQFHCGFIPLAGALVVPGGG